MCPPSNRAHTQVRPYGRLKQDSPILQFRQAAGQGFGVGEEGVDRCVS